MKVIIYKGIVLPMERTICRTDAAAPPQGWVYAARGMGATIPSRKAEAL